MGLFYKKEKWKLTEEERQSSFYRSWLLLGLVQLIIVAVVYGIYKLFQFVIQ